MRTLRPLSVFILSAALFTACTSGSRTPDKAAHTTQGPNSDLLRTDAENRAQTVSRVAYALKVRLNAKDQVFKGKNQISFHLKDGAAPLRVDMFEGRVTRLTVNGTPVSEDAKKKYWIEIPAHALKKGPNTVEIEYEQNYSSQGQGLHRFVDPETKDVFLHSQFETFDANRFFPCFDQPDIKATLQMTVEAPASWEVITTTPEVSVTKQGGRRIWQFEKTPVLSTYVFSLHAGPYKVWRDRYEDIPLRIFARPTMAKYVRAQEWFTWTKQGLRYFGQYFDYPYPFKKYDQLFVPEFNAGAMENVGAVTFNETFLRRSDLTREDRRRAASTLMHEMAHMWFGDLVTMKWWNDLWLNESFATIMAALSLYEATEFKESWQDFFAGMKSWAYWEDQLVTTHPIEAPVASVKQAYATFDGITYGKGAAVIKQLRAYVGPEAFKAGVREYFKTYAYKNAELKDFVAAIQNHTTRDLHLWADRWLKQSGVDKLAAQWSCNGRELHEIELAVTPAPGAKFRPQVVKIGLFKIRAGRLEDVASPSVELTETRQIVRGPWPCPDAVYPNYKDEGYLAVQLDPKTLLFAQNHVGQVSDSLLRTMIWRDLWEMVRMTEMPLMDYVQTVERHFPNERDTIINQRIVNSIHMALQYWPIEADAQERRMKFIGTMEAHFLNRFLSAAPGSDGQKTWFDNYVGIARTEKGLTQLVKWFGQKKVAAGFPLDMDRKWEIVRQLSRFNHPDAGGLLGQMKAEDRSDRGERTALAAEAIRPDLEIKRKWITELAKPKPELSLASARAVLSSLFPFEQIDLAKTFADDYYSYMKANGAGENEVYVKAFAATAAPLTCHATESERFKAFLNEGTAVSPSVTKVLKRELEEDERCQRIRAKARNP